MKFFILKMIVVAFCLSGVSSIFAQTLQECETIYIEFLANRLGPDIEKYEKAVVLGKEYLEKCGDLKDQETVKDYVTKQIPKIEKTIKEILDPHPSDPFISAIAKKDWDVVFELSKKIIERNPSEVLDLSLIFASIGFDNASANIPNDKYNNETINYAKRALQSMNEGKTSGTGNYGAFAYTYKTKECPDGKLNATGWMNYIIGYIMYVRQKQINEAIPYLYQATQIGCETKNIAEVYRLIGDWYFEEFKKTDNLALRKEYAKRVLDAYARVHRINSKNPNPIIRDRYLQIIKMLYKLVYNPDLNGFDLYLESIFGTPLIDPKSSSPLPKNEQ